MSFQIQTIDQQSQWDEFVNNLKPHTFLHTWQWGLFQKTLNNPVYYLGLFENDNLKGVALVYKVSARRGSFLFCPHGPLINWQEPEQFTFLIDYLYKLGQKEKVDFIRISPLVENSQEIAGLFEKSGFRKAPIHMHPELAWLLDITPSEDELLKNMKKNTRYSIRKAQKDGVKIKVSTDLKDLDIFYDIYQQTAQRQGFVAFSKDYIQKEFEIFAKDQKVLLFSAYYNNEVVASTIIIFSNGSSFYHHGASIKKYSNIPASELIQWEAINKAKQRGLTRHNFWGIAPENIPNHPWVGLSRFKKGFDGFSENYLSAQDLILTPKYWLNYSVEKIRKIKRRY